MHTIYDSPLGISVHFSNAPPSLNVKHDFKRFPPAIAWLGDGCPFSDYGYFIQIAQVISQINVNRRLAIRGRLGELLQGKICINKPSMVLRKSSWQER
jgi:hypothetical protein